MKKKTTAKRKPKAKKPVTVSCHTKKSAANKVVKKMKEEKKTAKVVEKVDGKGKKRFCVESTGKDKRYK